MDLDALRAKLQENIKNDKGDKSTSNQASRSEINEAYNSVKNNSLFAGDGVGSYQDRMQCAIERLQNNDKWTVSTYNEETGEYTTTISSGKALIEGVDLSFDAQEREGHIFKCWSVNGEEDPYIGRDKINGFKYRVNPDDAISDIIRIEPVYIPVEEYTIELGMNVKRVDIYYIDDTSDHLTEKTVNISSENIKEVVFIFEYPDGYGYDKYLLNGIKVDDNLFDVYELYEYADENNVICFDAISKER